MPKIRARYIGSYTVTLKDPTGVLDGEGRPITTGALQYGDTLMMNEEEVIGQTFFLNPRTLVLESQGAGRVVRKEHKHLNWDEDYDELLRLGYALHEGRSDFEAVPPTKAEEKAAKKADEKAAEEDTTKKTSVKKGE